MIIKITNHSVYDMHTLTRIVLKFIYDNKNTSLSETALMKKSIIKWNNHLKLKEDCGEMNAIDVEYREQLQRICWLLKKDDQGLLDKRKSLFKEHDINYRKFHRLPEAFKPEDFIKAKMLSDKVEKQYQ